MSHGRVRRRHRLAVQANDLAQAARDAGVAFGERDPLGADAAGSTPDAALRIDQGHAVLGPRQIVPRPLLGIPDPPRPSATRGTWIAANPAAFDPDPHTRAVPPLPTRAVQHDTRQGPESEYARAAIPSVLPCCGHIKRRHYRILDG